MKRKIGRNQYLRQLRNGKLKLSERICLYYCGKRDGKLQIIKEEDEYTSPFISQETHLFLAAIKSEQEVFAKKILYAQEQIELAKIQEHNKESQKKNYQDCRSVSLDDNFNVNFERAIATIRSQEQKMLLIKEREKKVLKLRCDQLYNVFLAKLSVYWSGVLKKSKEQIPLPFSKAENCYNEIDAFINNL